MKYARVGAEDSQRASFSSPYHTVLLIQRPRETEPNEMPDFFTTNEAEETVAALEMTARALQDVPTDVYSWRWVIISLHIAAQGFMVIALRDSAGLIPLRDDIATNWLEAYREDKPPPNERLDSFRNLYRKVKRKKIARFLNAKAFEPVGSQEHSMHLLCQLRDRFIHFLPMSWSLEVTGLPRMCSDVLDFVEFLHKEYRLLVWHREHHRRRIYLALGSARQILGRIA